MKKEQQILGSLAFLLTRSAEGSLDEVCKLCACGV